MILVLFVCALLAGLRADAVALYRRLWKGKGTAEAIAAEGDDNREVVYVVATPQRGPVVYQLDDRTRYNPSTCLLSGSGGEVRLTPLPDRLLQGFLQSCDHSLTHSQIYDLLWPGPNNYYPQRLHTTIARLRRILDQTARWTIESYGDTYRLKAQE